MSREEVLHFHRPSLPPLVRLYCATPALFSEFTRNEINGRESRLFARALAEWGAAEGKEGGEGRRRTPSGTTTTGMQLLRPVVRRPHGNEYAPSEREDERTAPRMRANAGDPSPSRASAENALRPKPSPSFFFALLGPRPRLARPGVFARPLNTLVIYSAHVLSP